MLDRGPRLPGIGEAATITANGVPRLLCGKNQGVGGAGLHISQRLCQLFPPRSLNECFQKTTRCCLDAMKSVRVPANFNFEVLEAPPARGSTVNLHECMSHGRKALPALEFKCLISKHAAMQLPNALSTRLRRQIDPKHSLYQKPSCSANFWSTRRLGLWATGSAGKREGHAVDRLGLLDKQER